MEEIQSLSDAQLREELKRYGMTNLGPVTGTSRGVYEKKLFKLKTESKVTPKKGPGRPPKTPAQEIFKEPASSAKKKVTRKTNKSESEDGSDDEIQPISPQLVTPPRSNRSVRKPVSSTPKERTPSPPRPVEKRYDSSQIHDGVTWMCEKDIRNTTRSRPANSIVPGLNTTLAGSLKTNSSNLLISGHPSPGSTPPRNNQKTPIRTTTHATVTSSYISPDLDKSYRSPKFAVHSSISDRSLHNLGHTTDEDDDDGEETSRIVHHVSSTGRDRRSVIRKAVDGFLGNNLVAGEHPGSNYELRRGTIRTNVTKDNKTGKYSVKQRTLWSDVPRILLSILILFFIVLVVAYLVASRPEDVAGTVGVLMAAIKNTAGFLYNYAIFPTVVLATVILFGFVLYWGHGWYRDRQTQEQEAFEDLVERIIDMVQMSSEEGSEHVTIPHVRDRMYPPAKRSNVDLKRWERAVDFINENESRISTECVLIRGQECQVWRWIPYKKTGWQGSAYRSGNGGAISDKVPTEALTRSLKIREVHLSPPEGDFDPLALVKLKILEKVYPVRPVHMGIDKEKVEDGILYMKLSNKEDALAAFHALHAKWFNGHLLQVKYIRDSRYAERFPYTANA